MAKGEKGRRRPWREKAQGPPKPGSGKANGRQGGGKPEFSKNKKYTNDDDDSEDVPNFSDMSDDDIGEDNAVSADADSIKDDVAKFAANLGLAVEGFSGSGFDDRDFRKPPKKVEVSKQKEDKKKGKSAADGKGDEATGKGQKGKKQSEKGERETEVDGGGAKGTKNKKGEKKKGALPPPPAGEVPEAEGAFAPAESFFDAGGGGIEDVPMGPWYEQAAELSSKLLPPPADVSAKGKIAKKAAADVSGEAPRKWDDVLQKMRAEGEELLHRAAEAYERGQGKSGKDVQWLVRARKAGTSADKVAAMTVMMQEDPVANVRSLDALLGMVSNKGGKRNAAIAIDALRELFVTSLLPDRKLRYLAQRPELETLASQGKDGEPLLRFWYWEDALKQRYDTFVTSLDALSRDNLQFLKEKALKTLFDLLVAKPEQEAKLLAALVNKLGDPERKVASKAGYLLARLLEQHPAMKRVVVQEIEGFVFRPHVGLRARYYAVVFLNQIILSKKGDGSALAKSLIGLYFGLFKALTALEADAEDPFSTFQKSLGKRPRQKTREVKKIIQSKKKRLAAKSAKGGAAPVSEDSTVGVDSRILSAILTGVNRAFPYVAADDVDALLREHTPELFRMVHAGNFNVSVQALLLLHQLMSAHQAVSERFYRALYAVLLSPALAKSSKAALFLSVLFKAMKSDLDSKRIAAFAKRLLQIAAHQSPPFACGALLLVSEVLKTRPILWGAVQQPEDKGDDLEHFEDVREDGDGPAEGPKSADPDTPKPSAPAPAADISGPVLGFSVEDDVSEDEGSPSDDSDADPDSSDADERRKRSADASTSSSKERVPNGRSKTAPSSEGLPNGAVNGVVRGDADTWPAKGRYDAKSREPSFCHAETACWWELTSLAAHAHPSVAAMAKTLLAGANVLYDGDPLRDLALAIFLDRFVEKKPRAAKSDGKFKGASFMQPLRKGDVTRSHLLVGAEAFAAVEESQVAAEDAFFYKFYTAKAAKKPGRKRGKGGDSSDEDSDAEGPSKKKAKKGKKKAAGGESDDDIENVDSDDDALEKILERGMGEEGEGSEDEGGEEGEEGGWDYDRLAKVLEKDDDADARSDGEESLDAAAESDDDDEGGFEGFAAAGSDDDDDDAKADVSGDDDDVSDEDADVSDGGEDEDSDGEGFDFGEDVSGSEGEGDGNGGAGEGGVAESSSEDEAERSRRKGKRNRAGRIKGANDGDDKQASEGEEEPLDGAKGVGSGKGSKKRKKGGVGASPFAAMEDFAHLLD